MQKKKKIAVCGKGGVGKTAVIAMLTNVLAEREDTGRLIIVDADPAMGLPSTLGIRAEKTIGQVRESIIEAAQKEGKQDINDMVNDIDFMVMEALTETQDFSFLAMGRTDSKGCFCSINGLLKSAINLVTEKFDTILIDGEAGLEQLNRQITEELDYLLILTDASNRGRETIGHIKKIVQDNHMVSCRNIGIIINRITDDMDKELLTELLKPFELDIYGFIPLDSYISVNDLKGKPLLSLPEDSAALKAVREIAQKLI